MLRALVNESNEVIQWPVWDKDIPNLFPTISLPDPIEDDTDLSHLGLINVPPTIRPEPSAEGLTVVLDTPIWIEGVLTRTYKEIPLNPAPEENLPTE